MTELLNVVIYSTKSFILSIITFCDGQNALLLQFLAQRLIWVNLDDGY